MRIGLQISSLKKYIQTRDDTAETFRRVRELGYQDVQLQWTGPDVDSDFLAELLRAHGMRCWGTQDYYDVVMARLDYEIAAAGKYNARYICVSGVPERFMSPDGLKAMAAELRATRDRLAEHGLILTFHPRYHEYVPMDGSTPTERLLELVPDMQLTLDAYHTEVCHLDTPALMRRYAGRVDLVHIKDAQALDPRAPLTPVGAGAINYLPVLRACEGAGVKVVLAEQESWQCDAFCCMAQSLGYLRGALDALGVAYD
ncbi:MAG TPA: sugar phosphate isomerase/epimerase [Candidatus Fimadaptatus faecigallinarum]|uniref:Sugar phosphate isomerase/epimerase n=1 Tax=Candidatus Fimadaptatus faecigallinarum TaxID=2840814 RepID=A0A9D1LSY7_9FIRM|nr:sugar phosphate isomerase/epimerase [Candidatus Fimadaptatus faecigallinarum]